MAWARDGWGELAVVAGTRAAWAGDLELAGVGDLLEEVRRGAEWFAQDVRGGALMRAQPPRHGVEHVEEFSVVAFKRPLAPNLREFGQDPTVRFLLLATLCCLCVEVEAFLVLCSE